MPAEGSRELRTGAESGLSVQFSDSATPRTAARQASLSITNSGSLLKCMSIESVIPSNHLPLRHPLLLLPSIFPSIRVFSNESVLRIRWPKDWSFSFSISPSEGIWWTAILEERRKTVMPSKEMFLSSVVFPPKYIMYQTLFWTVLNVNSFNSRGKSPGRCCYLHFAEKENEGHRS